MRKKIGLMMLMLISIMLVTGCTVFAAEPILMAGSWSEETIFGKDVRKNLVVKIFIETSIPSPVPDGAWDVSRDGNGSVYAWLITSAKDSTLYDLHIAGDGGVIASSGSYLFANYVTCKEINGLYNLDTRSVTGMDDMFYQCYSLTSLKLDGNFDTRKVINMNNMFIRCKSLTSLELGKNFDTSSVSLMSNMFKGCSSLTSLNLGENFDTSKVTNIAGMFYECSLLTSIPTGLDLSNTNIIAVGGASNGYAMMFSGCSSLTSARINSKYIGYRMFYGCDNLTNITITADVQGIYANGQCFAYTGDGTLKTNLINESSAMEDYDWSADNRAVTIVVPDTIAPTGTISLGSTYYEANGYKYVKSNEVTINLTASDDISEQSNIKVALINEKDYSRTNSNSSINWLSFSPSIQWTASSGKGLKRVYVIFKDEAGNQSLYLAT